MSPVMYHCGNCGVLLTSENWLSACQREGRRVCKKCHYEKVKKWTKNNRVSINERHRQYTKHEREKLICLLGGKCVNHMKNYGVKCTDMRVLQIDHINGGGCKERLKCHSEIYRLINKLPTEEIKKRYQILCANCNWIKKVEKHEVCRR